MPAGSSSGRKGVSEPVLIHPRLQGTVRGQSGCLQVRCEVSDGRASPEDLDSVLSLLANRYSKVLRAQVETTDRCLVTIGSECGLLNPWLVD